MSKIKHRSRNGCLQCRKRKIKCDETFPACNKCFDKKLECSYLGYTQDQIDKITAYNNNLDTVINNPLQPMDLCFLGRCNCPDHNLSYHPNLKKSTSQDLTYSYAQSPLYQAFQFVTQQQQQQQNQYHVLPLVKHISKISNLLSPLSVETQFHQIHPVDLLLHTFPFLDLIIRNILISPKTLDGSMLVCYSSIISTHGEFLPNFFEIQAICMNHVIEGLKVFNDTNAIEILSISISVDISLYFLTSLGYNQQSNFSGANGPISILKTIFEQSDKFPISYPVLKKFGESFGLKKI